MDLKLFDAEYRLVQLVWEREPIPSGELARLAQERLGWKRTTTYTVLKKLCNRGILINESAVVRSLVGKEQIQRYESRAVLERSFGGSLPQFVAAFLGGGKTLSPSEAQELQALIDAHRREES